MPSTAQGGSKSGLPDWRQRLLDEHGEDPARWLDQSLLEPQATRTKTVDRGHYEEVRLAADTDVSPPGETVRALIDGIDSFERLALWRAVERRVGRGEGGGPRDRVIEMLDERRAVLEEIGERPDRLPCGPWQSWEDWNDGDDSITADELRERQSSDVQSASVSTEHATASTSSSTASSLDQFATDGGEVQDAE